MGTQESLRFTRNARPVERKIMDTKPYENKEAVTCPDCNGTGHERSGFTNDKGELCQYKCERCEGWGWFYVSPHLAHNYSKYSSPGGE